MRTLRNHRLLRVAALVALAAMLLCVPAFAAEEGAEAVNSMYGTFWALVPPIIAITLALITKEAYSSLFIGVLVGALFSCEFAPVATLDMIVNDGLVAAVADNAGIFLFLVILGVMVALVNATGSYTASMIYAIVACIIAVVFYTTIPQPKRRTLAEVAAEEKAAQEKAAQA